MTLAVRSWSQSNSSVVVLILCNCDVIFIQFNELQLSVINRNDDAEEAVEDMSPDKKIVVKLFILSVPWCCNIGGTGSLYGTPLNVLLKANLER